MPDPVNQPTKATKVAKEREYINEIQVNNNCNEFASANRKKEMKDKYT